MAKGFHNLSEKPLFTVKPSPVGHGRVCGLRYHRFCAREFPLYISAAGFPEQLAGCDPFPVHHWEVINWDGPGAPPLRELKFGFLSWSYASLRLINDSGHKFIA